MPANRTGKHLRRKTRRQRSHVADDQGHLNIQTDPQQEQVLELQRTVGNQATQNLLIQGKVNGPRHFQGLPPVRGAAVQRAPTTTIDFEEGETVVGHRTSLGPNIDGVSVNDYIDTKIVDRMKEGWDAHITNYLSAISNFETFMDFPADKEAEADYLGVALKFGAEQLLKAAVDEAKKTIPGLDIAVDLVKALGAEYERAKAAADKIKARDFIVDFRNKVSNMNRDFQRDVGGVRDKVKADYAKEAAKSPELSKPAPSDVGDVAITGPAAEFLNKLKSAADVFANGVPTAEIYLQQMAEKWVNQDRSNIRSEGGGKVYSGGRIYITIKVYKDGNSLSFDKPTKAQLASDEADHTASIFNKLMKDEGKSINDLNIEKYLTVEVEDEVPWGFNDYYTYYYHFHQPDQINWESAFGSPIRDEEVQAKVPVIKAAIKDTVGPQTLSTVQKLEGRASI